VIRKDYEMRFNGCKCKACQAAAVGAAGLVFISYVYPTAYGDECWHTPEARIYCQSFVPEQPHTHNATVASSTSSITTTFSIG
jgi:hypothetical protein